MAEENLVPTAENTLKIIELLLDQPEGLSPQEMLPHLAIPRSTLFLLLRTLKTLGYVEQLERRGRYRLGQRLASWRLAQPSPAAHDLLSAFYQEAGRTARSESLALVTLSGGQCLVLAQVESVQAVRSVLTPGKLYADLEAARMVLANPPDAQTRANGYTLAARGESLDLALPVCRDGRQAHAALVLSAPRFRRPPEILLEEELDELRRSAAHISYQLGAVIYAPYQEQSEPRVERKRSLEPKEIQVFLQGPWAARLACVRPDGHPHVIPVWQEWDGEAFLMIAWAGSQWSAFVLNNPSVSLTVDEPWPPLRRVVVRGRAEQVSLSESKLEGLVERLTRRYLGQPSFGLTGQIGQVFRVAPESLSGYQGLPGGEAGG